ncbi:hypothetical protein ATANTOWER_019245 [Ataeniobius toweri]|uniref:Uncharacterized protein n=1 Tax=Ataeniobius toweri TaxID=208326 RepID=A0ABU7CLD9_9TELE|nr:hypothetical protein [Ataeniobius toweri]
MWYEGYHKPETLNLDLFGQNKTLKSVPIKRLNCHIEQEVELIVQHGDSEMSQEMHKCLTLIKPCNSVDQHLAITQPGQKMQKKEIQGPQWNPLFSCMQVFI